MGSAETVAVATGGAVAEGGGATSSSARCGTGAEAQEASQKMEAKRQRCKATSVADRVGEAFAGASGRRGARAPTLTGPMTTTSAADSAPTDLPAIVREAIASSSGLKGGELKKALPKSAQRFHAEALILARKLAAAGEVHRYAKGATERFYATDPIATLERSVPALLADEGPLDGASLKRAVERAHRGLADLLGEWLKGALAQQRVFLWGPAPRSKAKRYGHKPDLSLLLKKPLLELRKAMKVVEAAGVAREDVMDVFRTELGLSSARAERDTLRKALAGLADENKPGALLLLGDVRARAKLDHEAFDRAALALAHEGVVTLHAHDFPSSLPETERAELLLDRGAYYVGITPRRQG